MTVLDAPTSNRNPEPGELIFRDARNVVVDSRHRGLLRGLVSAARPHQWVKNVAVLIVPGLMFLTIGIGGAVAAAIATGAFCLAASSVYLLNDTLDRDQDRLHPVKRHRPIASGRIRPVEALGAAAALAVVSLLSAGLVSTALFAVIAAYLCMTGLYSVWLKRIAYVDVMALAGGFVLRVVAGAVAVHASAPPLLLTAVFAGACFLAFGKRHAELALLGRSATAHRAALAGYHDRALKVTIRIAETISAAAFGLWILTAIGGVPGLILGLAAGGGLAQALDTHRRTMRAGGGGNPTADLTSNLALLPGLAIAAFVALSVGIIR